MNSKNINIETIKRLYLEQNKHPRDIAKILNTSRNKIYKLIREAGFEKTIEQKKIESKLKREKTNLEKFGVTSPLKSQDILAKVQKTNLERYGNVCSLSNPDVNRKRTQTYQDNWGCHPKESHIKHLDQLNRDYVLKHFVENQELFFDDFIEYFNISGVKGRRLKHEWQIEYLKNHTTKHKQELEVFDFIRSLLPNETIFYQDRKTINPRELDLYLPDKHLAIEFDGIMDHSFGIHQHYRFNNSDEESINKKNHQMKTELCERQNIKLLHIFENEWRTKRNMWESVILYHLGLSDKVFARKCIIREVDNKSAKEFLEENHLQGSCNSLIKIGLYYNQELVALMTFGKPRFNKQYEYELLRFCCKLNTSVVGGASRLFKYFIKAYKPKSIISYANRRWSTGNLYNLLGFELIAKTKPGYHYFHMGDRLKLLSRNKFQKYKLSRILENFNPDLTETENMYNHQFRKIYDSGQLVFAMLL